MMNGQPAPRPRFDPAPPDRIQNFGRSTMKPTREFIEDTLSGVLVDPRIRALYELCFMHRFHNQDEIVADKLRMIVRACVDQGQAIAEYSPELAAHLIVRSGVDRWFASLATAEHIDPALKFDLHKRVMDVFVDLPETQARSLASKYLHYHFPELFFIYDAGVERAAYDLGEGECGYLARGDHDPLYSSFFACCRKLSDRYGNAIGRPLNPRELDMVLRAWHHHAPDLPAPAAGAGQPLAA